MNSSIEIRVFGDGNGETIFIEFENNKIGVIDFGYKDFITWFENYSITHKLKNIEFLLWTHPHDDHSRYLINLLEFCETNNISINYFTRFAFSKMQALSKVIDEQHLKISSYNYISKAKPQYLFAIFEKIEKLKKQNLIKNTDKNLMLGHTLFESGNIHENISITCIAPCQKDMDLYQEKYEKAAQKSIAAKELKILTKQFGIESNIHNLISVALCINYHNLKIILGSDVENSSWAKILDDNRYHKYTKGKIILLKAPHHGSNGAYSENIWKNWGENYDIIITPYNKSKIPKKEVLEKMLKISKNISILKDIKNNTVLEDFGFLLENIEISEEEITTAKEATHQKRYIINSSGEIKSNWE